MKNRPPTLTVSTQGLQSPSASLPPGALGPTAPGSLRSRPLGARRRQPLNAGLFIANPDSSDEDDSAVNGTPSSQTNAAAPSHSSGGSTHQVSPQRSFRSSSPTTRNSPQHSSPHASPVGQAGTIGRNASAATPLPPIPPQQSGSTGSNSLPSASSSVSPGAPPTMNTTSRPLPILNAPNTRPSSSNPHHVGASNPILSLGPLGSPLLSAFPLPSPSGHEMASSLSQNSTCNGSTGHAPSSASSSRPMPPQPPPQPERHRDFSQKPRAFTTPTMERERGTIGDARVNSIYREQPGSPNRALPPLPPMKAQSVPSPTAGQLNQLHGSSPSNHPGHFHPPHLFPPTPPTPAGPSLTRVSSPDDALHVPDRRQRSNSMFKVLLQVTTDNEQFSIVDITGVHTAEAIRERIFSKVGYSILLCSLTCTSFVSEMMTTRRCRCSERASASPPNPRRSRTRAFYTCARAWAIRRLPSSSWSSRLAPRDRRRQWSRHRLRRQSTPLGAHQRSSQTCRLLLTLRIRTRAATPRTEVSAQQAVPRWIGARAASTALAMLKNCRSTVHGVCVSQHCPRARPPPSAAMCRAPHCTQTRALVRRP